MTERTEFQADGNVQDLLDLLTDKRHAQAVLSSILSSNLGDDINEEFENSELDEFNSDGNSRIQTVFDANFLFKEIESQIASDFGDFKFAVGAVTTFSSIGYILWTLRGGALMAVAMSQLPSWKMIDPLMVLDSYAGGAGGLEEDEEFGDFFG